MESPDSQSDDPLGHRAVKFKSSNTNLTIKIDNNELNKVTEPIGTCCWNSLLRRQMAYPLSNMAIKDACSNVTTKSVTMKLNKLTATLPGFELGIP